MDLVNKMDRDIYKNCLEFKRKYPFTVAWRLKAHSSVIQKHINDDEVVLYTFCGQYNRKFYEIFFTSVFVFTNKRLIIGRKGLFGQYSFISVTPDMMNDFEVRAHLLWGEIEIDTIKEKIIVTNLSKKCLDEVETATSKYMMNEKLRLMRKKRKED